MALYNETDDWQRFAREQMQNSAQNLQQKQAGLDAAKNQKTKTTLESALSGLFNGLKERGSDILNTVKNIEKTKYGWLDEIIANNDLKNAQKDDSARRNEIAKKYGFNSYSEAINSDKAGDNFWNEIKASNEQTKTRLKKNTDAYRNSITDVTKVNTNEAKGQALNTIDSVLGLIPGVGGVVANVAGGGISGVGDEYKAAGREGRDVDWSNAGKNALIGAASGVAGSLGGKAVGKVAGKMGGSTIGKLVGSNLAQGTIGGASAGAVGGALGTAMNGGTLEDALLAAKEGAKAGAIGGGTMASVMGLGGTALDKIRNRGTVTPQAIEPVDAEIVQKNRIEAPTAERIPSTVEAVEPVSNKRGIAIQDLNAGVEEIPVKTVVGTPSRGKYIDSVVDRAKANLPESKKTAAQILYDTTNGEYSNAAEMLAGKTMADGGQFGGYANEALADYFPKDLVTAIRNGAREIYGEQTPFDAYGLNSREGLPLLNRQEYYNDRTGKPGASITSEDIPAYMQDRMRNDAGKSRYSSSDNESIMREIFGDNMDKEQMYDLYEQLAQTTIDPRIYSDDNLGAALAIDPELNRRATQILADQTRKNIAVQGGPAISDNIPVADRTTRYTENTLPARTYEQPTARANKVMNSEPTATKATPTTAQTAPEQRVTTPEPELDYITEVQRQKAQIQADKLKRQAIGGVLDQYSTTRLNDHINGLPEAVEDMLKLGFTDRAEIDYYANKMTGKDGELSKVIRNSLKNAEPVKMETGTTWEKIYEAAGADKTAQKEIKSFVDSQAGKYQKDADGTWNRQDLYDFGKDLETKGYKLKDRYERLGNEKDRACSNAYIDLSERIIDNATNGVEVSGNINLKKLISIAPDNTEHISRMQNLAQNAKTVDDIRHAMANTTKMALLKKAEDFNINTFGQNQGDFGKNANRVIKGVKAMNSYNPAIAVAQAGIEMASESPKIKQRNIRKNYEKAQKLQAQANGEAPINYGKFAGIKEKLSNIKDANIAQGAKNLGNKVAGIANNATANLNNDSLAGINGIRTRNGNTIEFNALGNQAQQFANKQMGKAEAERSQNRLENAQAVANAQNEYDNALADYNAQEANYNAQMAQSQGSNGAANMLDRINRAMELAMQAGDITAYGQLADLYKQAYSIYEMQNPKSNKTEKALSASQSKALAAQQQLDELVGMTPDAGTVASSIPIAKNIVKLTGGNEYANQADALANTLGYLLSGANIKKEELEGIYRDYVPTAFDSEAVKQHKIANARNLIQSYMSDTSAPEA